MSGAESRQGTHRPPWGQLGGAPGVRQAFLGNATGGPSGSRSCWDPETCCLACHHLAEPHRLNQKYAFVNLAKQGPCSVFSISRCVTDTGKPLGSLLGAQVSYSSPALLSCFSHCLSQPRSCYPRGGQCLGGIFTFLLLTPVACGKEKTW